MTASPTLSATSEPAVAPAPRHGGGGGALVTLCFAAATFLGAFLLFLVQPLIAKYILPWFGGGAAVWTTCMLFFQTVLLGGYLYAHLGVSRLRPRAQAAVHALVLLAAAAAALPAVVPAEFWKPPADAAGANPTWRILLLLGATVGLPCLALSATSPLLHAWYSRLRPGAAVYRLFALSNLGSLLALLAYPLIVEPMLPRHAQATAWAIALAAFAVLCGTCAFLAARRVGADAGALPTPADATDDVAAARRARTSGPTMHPAVRGILWLVLPACASALLLGTTNAITQDFAPIPFLWIAPLALYLITFIIAFDRPGWYRRGVFGWVLAASVAAAAGVLFYWTGSQPIALIVVTLPLAMFVGCMTLHGELARLRPPPRQLTAYYLTIAAGGALGGLLVGVAAPLLLSTYSELPAALWACCLLAFIVPHVTERRMPAGAIGLLGIAGVMGLGPVLWASSHRVLAGGTLAARSRDFYGVLSVWDVTNRPDGGGGKGVVLQHAGTTHGHQHARPSLRATPTTYYHRDTGVGLALGERSALPTPRRVGLVGLGAGTLAAYAKAGDTYRFYEISPAVQRYARERFSYLEDAERRGAKVDVTIGDARLSLEREAEPQQYDAIVLDAFSGDAIPVHLLTAEALDVCRRHLAPSGVLCVHVSNNHLDLQPVVTAAARRLGWHAASLKSEQTEGRRFPAVWMMVSPDPKQIEHLKSLGAQAAPEPPRGFKPWTDEHASVLKILR